MEAADGQCLLSHLSWRLTAPPPGVSAASSMYSIKTRAAFTRVKAEREADARLQCTTVNSRQRNNYGTVEIYM